MKHRLHALVVQIEEAPGISEGYLSSLFRRETGKTVTKYVSEKRAEYAAIMGPFLTGSVKCAI